MHRFLNIMLYAALLAGFLLYGWEELTLAAKKLVFWALTALPQLRRLPARVATWRESRRSLKVKVRILNEGKKENFISAAYTGMKRTLNTTGSQDKVRLIRLVSLCTGSGKLHSSRLFRYPGQLDAGPHPEHRHGAAAYVAHSISAVFLPFRNYW